LREKYCVLELPPRARIIHRWKKFPLGAAEKRDPERYGEREYRAPNSNLSDQGSRHTPDRGAMCMGKRFL
jgi:hypothetical protein